MAKVRVTFEVDLTNFIPTNGEPRLDFARQVVFEKFFQTLVIHALEWQFKLATKEMVQTLGVEQPDFVAHWRRVHDLYCEAEQNFIVEIK